MLLEALVACAGVTLKAVATALEIPLRDAHRARRGRSRLPRHAGRRSRGAGRLPRDPPRDSISTPTRPQEKIDALLKLTERYCVVFQTLNSQARLERGRRAPRTLTAS